MKFFPKINIYDKYIFNQVMVTTFVAILLFTVVWIAPEMLLNTIKKTLAGDYGIKTAILVLFYELPKILGKAFPAWESRVHAFHHSRVRRASNRIFRG